jgi:ligand-binding sensor domain-containing protein/two-component sensor histidine kinase
MSPFVKPNCAVYTSLCCILFLITTAAKAQQPPFYFKKLDAQSGLSNSKVKCMVQDRRGFMWIGTEDGLNRYDGSHFVKFRHQPSQANSISGNVITDIVEDKEGVLWIATEDGGLNRYDYRLAPKYQFKSFKHQPGDSTSIRVNVINNLLDDGKGNIWLATGGAGVLCFNKEQEKFTRKILDGRTLYDLCTDKNGIIWGGREGGSILKIDPATGKYEEQKEYANFYKKDIPHVVVTTLFRDGVNDIWFGSWDKALYRYNGYTGKEETFTYKNGEYSFGEDEAIAFNQDDNQNIWIGGKRTGLYVFDRNNNRFYHYVHDPAKDGTLCNNTVNCIYRDRSGNMWLGTNSGISIYNPMQQSFRQQFLPPQQGAVTVYDFLREDNGSMWIATSLGLYLQSADGKFFSYPLSYNNTALQVTKLYKDPDGTLYIGTNYTFFRFDAVAKKIQALPNTDKDAVMNRLIESRIVSVVRDTIDGNPVMVTAPYGHFISYYDLVKQKWISRLDTVQKIRVRYGILDNLIRKVVKTSDGQLWLANVKEGLGSWNAKAGGKVEYFVNNPRLLQSISNNSVYDIVEDNRHNLWISTYGGGLNYFVTASKKFVHINSANNLLEGIQTDAKGNVWMISNGNLHKYDIYSKSYMSFDLPDIEKSGGIKGYIHKDRDGFFYMAGNNYYIRVHPDSIRAKHEPPKVLVTDFKIFDTSFSHLLSSRQITLKYNQNFFSIEFAAPYFTGGAAVQYEYQLEGFEKDWINAGTRNTVSYTNVDGGTYRFKVRATAEPGVWGNDYAVVLIEVIPPIWKRLEFYVVSFAIVLLIIYALYRYRINELLKRQAIRNKIAQDLHDSVGSTLSSVSVYSQVAKIQHEKGNNQELKDVLQKISVTSTDMISEMNDIVWAINPRNDSMEKIIQRMESFAKPLLQAKNISFSFRYDPAVLNINLPMEKRKNFYLIFKEAVNNVLKYSACKHLEVSIQVSQHTVTLLVKDDGQGFDISEMKALAAKSLSGNGLVNMKRRATEMKGECAIGSLPGKGTTVSLRFPLT